MLRRTLKMEEEAERVRRAGREGKGPEDVLGVARGSSETEIRRAFLRLSKILHPDKGSSGSSDAFQAIQRARQQLMEPSVTPQWSGFCADEAAKRSACDGHAVEAAKARWRPSQQHCRYHHQQQQQKQQQQQQRQLQGEGAASDVSLNAEDEDELSEADYDNVEERNNDDDDDNDFVAEPEKAVASAAHENGKRVASSKKTASSHSRMYGFTAAPVAPLVSAKPDRQYEHDHAEPSMDLKHTLEAASKGRRAGGKRRIRRLRDWGEAKRGYTTVKRNGAAARKYASSRQLSLLRVLERTSDR